MDSSHIEQYLGFLGQKLAEMQIKATIILLGGALMVTQIGNRKSTQDIDVVIATNDRRTYQAVQQAIALVAGEKRLPPAWLNDDVTIVVDQIGKPKAPKHWKTYANLTVYVPELEYMLALKLFSGRPGNRSTSEYPHEGSSLVNCEQLYPKRPASSQGCVYSPGHRPLFCELA